MNIPALSTLIGSSSFLQFNSDIEILNEFENRPVPTTDCGVSCPSGKIPIDIKGEMLWPLHSCR